MTGTILTKQQVEQLGLTPTGVAYGIKGKFYRSQKFLVVLEEMKYNRFFVQVCMEKI